MADSLLFDGVDDYIRFPVSNLGINMGIATSAVICKATVDGTARTLCGASGTFGYGIRLSAANTIELKIDFTQVAGPLSLTAADGWALVAITKDQGDAVPRFHRYLYSSAEWMHQDGSVSIGDSLSFTDPYDFGGTATTWSGNILNAAVWKRILTDAEFELLPLRRQAWWDLDSLELWRFDSLDPIMGINNAHEFVRSGVSLDAGDAPVGWDDSLTKYRRREFEPQVHEVATEERVAS